MFLDAFWSLVLTWNVAECIISFSTSLEHFQKPWNAFWRNKKEKKVFNKWKSFSMIKTKKILWQLSVNQPNGPIQSLRPPLLPTPNTHKNNPSREKNLIKYNHNNTKKNSPTKKLFLVFFYWCYYPHWSRDSVSPKCRICYD